jgi:hypothetical protein
MDNKILYTAKFTHHDLKFHKVWWKSDKRFGSWSGRTDGQTDRPIPIYPPYVVWGGYKKSEALKNLELSSKQDNYRPKESEIIVLHYFVPR